jgi:hypothetical protein
MAFPQTLASVVPFPQVENNTNVYTIFVYKGIVYIGGDFSTVNGIPRNGLAAINPETNEVTGWNPGLDGGALVRTISIYNDVIYVGGAFTKDTNVNAAAFLPDGSFLGTAWRPNPDNEVWSIDAGSSGIYFGGAFNTIYTFGGVPVTRKYAAATNIPTTGFTISPWNPNIDGGWCLDVAVTASEVYLVGDFAQINGGAFTRARAARVNKTTGAADSWDPAMHNSVYGVLVHSNGDIYLSGDFTVANSGAVARRSVVRVDAITGAAVLTFNALVQSGATTYSVVEYLGALLLAGNFNTAGGSATAENTAIIDPDTGLIVGPEISPNGETFIHAFLGNEIFVGGTVFDNYDREGGLAAFNLPMPGAPRVPVISFYLRKDNQTVLKWGQVVFDVNNYRFPIDGYYIYRSTNENLETYELVQTITTRDITGAVDTMFTENIVGFYAYRVTAFSGGGESEPAEAKAVNSSFGSDFI